MKKIFIVILFIVNINPFPVSYSQNYIGSFEFEGRTRKYEVYLPQNFHANMPVVFAIHGYTGSINSIKDRSKMHEIADTMGIITVYPQSASISWNTGEKKPWFASMYDTTVSDVGFFSVLIDTLYSHYNIDLNRVYACGFSSGGEMSFRLITDLGYRFAAAASVSGLLNEVIGNVKPIRPFPIIQIHGTADPLQTYEDPPYNLWSMEKTLNFWIENNECTSQADTITLPDKNPNDGSTVEKISYTNCSGDTKVIHYKVLEGGHSWPGSPGANQDFNATVEILNFFNEYENPLIETTWIKAVEIFPHYLNPERDTLFIKAQISNPGSHSVMVYAKILNAGNSVSDSLQLYDDGFHFDKDPNDNIWGSAKLLSGMGEDIYRVEVYTYDSYAGTLIKGNFFNYFTTVGPVVLANYEIVQNGADFITLKYALKNNSLTYTVPNVKAVLLTTDNNVRNTPGYSQFGDIAPGEVKSQVSFPNVIYTQNNPSSIDFTVNIFSNNRFFWSDRMDLIVEITEDKSNLPIEYALKQNYPNPFNPVTKIKYQIPELSFIMLKVYNVLGNEIVTLINEEKSPGTYEVEFNSHSGEARNLPSGVYLYQLRAGSFVQTKKMILLR
jgi:polyhydroxybutyrate depolymerase